MAAQKNMQFTIIDLSIKDILLNPAKKVTIEVYEKQCRRCLFLYIHI